LGRVFRSSEILALFKSKLIQLNVYGLWRGERSKQRVHFLFSYEYESHGYACGELLRVGMFFS